MTDHQSAEREGFNHMEFFSTNVDAWGAAEWFDRLAKAVREQDAAVMAGNDLAIEMCRNIAASSAMRLVREFEHGVRAALASTPAAGEDKIDWREPAAKWLESEADLRTNSLHCGDSQREIVLTHKFSGTLYGLAKRIRDLPAPSSPVALREALERELSNCRQALETINAHRKDDQTQRGNERFYQGKVAALEFALAALQSPKGETIHLSGETCKCQCPACLRDGPHDSDCSVHNALALPTGPCDCSAKSGETGK